MAQSCPTLCDPIDWRMPGFPVHYQLLEFSQTHVHQVSDAIQPSHPLTSPSLPTFSLSQHQGLFQWVSSLHQVAKVLEFQLQPLSFQWIFRTDFLEDIHTWLREKNVALTRQNFVGKVMSLLFNMLSRLVIAFLPRSKCLLISWLQSTSAVILQRKKIKSLTVSIFSPSICHELWNQMTWS